MRDTQRAAVTTALVVAAADPLNLAGVVTPGPRGNIYDRSGRIFAGYTRDGAQAHFPPAPH